MVQGDVYGNYTSNYVAQFVEYLNGIVVVDSLAAVMHPEWNKKTENRTSILSKELAGRKVHLRVTDVFTGKDTFEATL